MEAVEIGDLDLLDWGTKPYWPFPTERLDDADAVTGIIGHTGWPRTKKYEEFEYNDIVDDISYIR